MFIKTALIIAVIAATFEAAEFDVRFDQRDSFYDRISALNPSELKSSVPKCPLVITGKECPHATVFNYYSCCGTLYAECCFYFQDWMNLLIAVVIGLIILSVIIRILQAICGARR